MDKKTWEQWSKAHKENYRKHRIELVLISKNKQLSRGEKDFLIRAENNRFSEQVYKTRVEILGY